MLQLGGLLPQMAPVKFLAQGNNHNTKVAQLGIEPGPGTFRLPDGHPNHLAMLPHSYIHTHTNKLVCVCVCVGGGECPCTNYAPDLPMERTFYQEFIIYAWGEHLMHLSLYCSTTPPPPPGIHVYGAIVGI